MINSLQYIERSNNLGLNSEEIVNIDCFYKKIIFAIVFSVVSTCAMSMETVNNAFALWAYKKIRIQEIPFDKALLDEKTIIDTKYWELQKFETMQMNLSSTLLFDQTDRYLQRVFSKTINFTGKDSYALSFEMNEVFCKVTYDLQSLQTTSNESLTFIKPAEFYIIGNDGNLLKDIFIQSGFFLYDCLKNALKAHISFFKHKETKESCLYLCNFFDDRQIEYGLSFSHRVTCIGVNNALNMIAAILDDERIMLLSPIAIDTFRTFNNNYDINFVYS